MIECQLKFCVSIFVATLQHSVLDQKGNERIYKIVWFVFSVMSLWRHMNQRDIKRVHATRSSGSGTCHNLNLTIWSRCLEANDKLVWTFGCDLVIYFIHSSFIQSSGESKWLIYLAGKAVIRDVFGYRHLQCGYLLCLDFLVFKLCISIATITDFVKILSLFFT